MLVDAGGFNQSPKHDSQIGSRAQGEKCKAYGWSMFENLTTASMDNTRKSAMENEDQTWQLPAANAALRTPMFSVPWT